MSEEKKLVMEQFSKNAKEYVQSVSHAKGKDLEIILDMLQPSKSWEALDIATGGGHLTKLLSPYVRQIYTTDLTPMMLREARTFLDTEYRNIAYVVADAENLPFMDGQFDLVGCRIAAHHFPDKSLFLKEVSRVLKPGGVFLLVDNIVPDDKGIATYINTIEKMRDKSHVSCLSAGEWEEYAAEAGMNISQEVTRKKVFDFPVWVSRTTESQQQVNEVIQYIKTGTKEQREYIAVREKDEEIKSIEIDEWITVFTKQ
ncbi:SAM-dependent methyltransferase [Virgibacillus sp. 7505]|uniref:class I SAM-dependent methyltransferase n=1 Tax=Virgibacillus sp. 7505 TaxID=2022548 RepID=UPI000BA6B3C8|nr:class I SAM-dependent methyltransferase [Virgibacillus sp. 7505]PAE16293.1 SAM-dependent methyltransferase [Virgibacillus sp. 7505]